MDKVDIKKALVNKQEIIVNSPILEHEYFRYGKGIIIQKVFRLFRPITYKVLFKDYETQLKNNTRMCNFYKEELELTDQCNNKINGGFIYVS